MVCHPLPRTQPLPQQSITKLVAIWNGNTRTTMVLKENKSSSLALGQFGCKAISLKTTTMTTAASMDAWKIQDTTSNTQLHRQQRNKNNKKRNNITSFLRQTTIIVKIEQTHSSGISSSTTTKQLQCSGN